MDCERGYAEFCYAATAACWIIALVSVATEWWNQLQSRVIIAISLLFMFRHIFVEIDIPGMEDWNFLFALGSAAVVVLGMNIFKGVMQPTVVLPILGFAAVYNLTTNITGFSLQTQNIVAACVAFAASVVILLGARMLGEKADKMVYLITSGLIAPMTAVFLTYAIGEDKLCDDPADIADDWLPWVTGGAFVIVRAVMYTMIEKYHHNCRTQYHIVGEDDSI